ncbi:methyl-accepting chemotaxis protein [Bacillus solitudinis]|uniref:methyl-accepting chemotaxis protein n=1 Tax=Bacillus solitudinis TaxID=2014074 RepID=UPI000C2412A9|nr:methyl-accepting chemotaxis protein [Bacillus solitudinis]
MNFPHRFMWVFVLVLVIFSFFDRQIQAGMLKSVTEDLPSLTERSTDLTNVGDTEISILDNTKSIIINPTETVIEEVDEDVSETSEAIEAVDSKSSLLDKTTNITSNEIETVIKKVDEDISETSRDIKAMVSDSPLIDKETNTILNEMATVTEKVDEILFETTSVLTAVEPILPSIGLIYNILNLRIKPIKPDELTGRLGHETELNIEIKENLEPAQRKSLDEELDEALFTQCCDPSAIVPKNRKPKQDNTATTSVGSGSELKVKIRKSKTLREPEPNNIPVPVGTMSSYTVLPYQSKQGLKKAGSHSSPDVMLPDSIPIMISKSLLVNQAKLFVSNRANEPPDPPPKHVLFLI